MAFKKLVKCPACKFTNRFGDAKCIICKAALPQTEEGRAAEPPKPESLVWGRGIWLVGAAVARSVRESSAP